MVIEVVAKLYNMQVSGVLYVLTMHMLQIFEFMKLGSIGCHGCKDTISDINATAGKTHACLT